MIKVKVFGSTPPYDKCKELEKRANKVASKYLGQVEVSNLDAISDEGQKYNVFFTPTVVINDNLCHQERSFLRANWKKQLRKKWSNSRDSEDGSVQWRPALSGVYCCASIG